MANGQRYPRQWENINSSLQRIKVPGGWLIRSSTTIIIRDKEAHASEALLKIEDPDNNWQLEIK